MDMGQLFHIDGPLWSPRKRYCRLAAPENNSSTDAFNFMALAWRVNTVML
jgi:hypothetical protein